MCLNWYATWTLSESAAKTYPPKLANSRQRVEHKMEARSAGKFSPCGQASEQTRIFSRPCAQEQTRRLRLHGTEHVANCLPGWPRLPAKSFP